MSEKICIIYMSCDKFSDLWIEYFKLFRHYWPECPFKVYALTNTDGPSIEDVENIQVGEDVSWSDNLLKALDQVDCQYVFLLLDDFFIIDQVPHEWVMRKMEWAIDNEVNCLRLNSRNPKPASWLECGVGLIPKGALYRTSTICPLWNKEVLRKTLKSGESAWQFELDGSVRSDEFGEFYSVSAEPFRFANCVIKGRWNPLALYFLRRRGVQLDLSRRPTMSAMECFFAVLGWLRSKLLLLFPYQARRSIRGSAMRFVGREI